jgi:hypothetical protein
VYTNTNPMAKMVNANFITKALHNFQDVLKEKMPEL